MKAILHRDLVLHDIPRTIVDADISTYFQAQFAKIRSDSEYLDGGWPGDKTIDDLVQKADGLFIYAATVCRFINAHKEHWSPQGLLEVFIPDQKSGDVRNRAYEIPSGSPTAELDTVYLRVLEHSLKR
jgi:hypothetical protein